MELTTEHLLTLYGKYDRELRDLARSLRRQFHRMTAHGFGAVFGDVEGEILYLLLRETRPERVFEISPNAGWSTNYILAALTANGAGLVHSFELLPTIGHRATEAVIRANQHEQWDQQRLVVHVGDVRETVQRPTIGSGPDFLLLDSCHEAWFAHWYIESLFPRVKGPVIIQDIAFTDQLEPTSEARHVWGWAERHNVRLTLLGALETELARRDARAGYAERRDLRSNAVYLHLPAPAQGPLPQLDESPERRIDAAWHEARWEVADDRLNRAVATVWRQPWRANRHRLLVRAGLCYRKWGEPQEAWRCFERALAVALQAGDRAKGLTELLEAFWLDRQWALVLRTLVLIGIDPRCWGGAIIRIRHTLGKRFGRRRPRP